MATRPKNYAVKQSSDPAAGAEVSYTVDEDCIVKFFSVALVTGSDAANRQVHVVFKDANAVEYFRVTAGGTHAASLTRQYVGRPGDYAAPAVADTAFTLPLPLAGVPVFKNGTITTSTTNLDSSGNEDNFGILKLLVERYD